MKTRKPPFAQRPHDELNASGICPVPHIEAFLLYEGWPVTSLLGMSLSGTRGIVFQRKAFVTPFNDLVAAIFCLPSFAGH